VQATYPPRASRSPSRPPIGGERSWATDVLPAATWACALVALTLAPTFLSAQQTAAAAPQSPPGTALLDIRAANPEQILRQGEDLARAGRIAEALAVFGRLARAYPTSEVPHLAAANALVQAGRLAEAAREYELAAPLAREPGPIWAGLARVYLDPRLGRYAEALTASRAASRRQPWLEESYYLQARSLEGLGDQEAARGAYRVLLANFPTGEYRDEAQRGLDRLSRVTYGVTLGFRFTNHGVDEARRVHLRVQAARGFPPYSEARLLELPPGSQGRLLADGTRYFDFQPFDLAPGQERTLRVRYAVAVSAAAWHAAAAGPGGDDPARWLAPSPYVESDAPEILALARTLAPSGTPYDRARRFYEFVLKRLTYTVQDRTLGALGALARPERADCTEFAALFVALSRASGIPARPVFGYLYEPAKERYTISHLWAEFWDGERGWVTVDPTNGSLAPARYFGRVEADYVPLWIPSAEFGDLSGVRVTYETPTSGDTLSTDLVAEIRLLAPAEFEAAPEHPVAYAQTPIDGGGNVPLAPAAAACAVGVGLVLLRRRRSSG
jgi:transglutaminase-like putative cysteine protease